MDWGPVNASPADRRAIHAPSPHWWAGAPATTLAVAGGTSVASPMGSALCTTRPAGVTSSNL